jgi:transcriptional regulator with GAF, ATPase, and Fis domain
MDDLDGAMAGMERLASLLTLHEPFEATLTKIAEFSASAVASSGRVAVSVVQEGRRVALATSDADVHRAEHLQYELGEGPTLTAISERRVAVSGSLGGDESWPRFGSAAARSGFHSVLVAPMVLAESTVGALSVYAEQKNAFDDRSVERAQRYAVPAAAVIHNLHLLHQSQAQVAQLGEALKTRGIIDQAIGILRSRNGCTADEAFSRLRRISNTDRVKLVDVAASVVEQSVRQAQARTVRRRPPDAAPPPA